MRLIISILVSKALADTCADCRYSDLEGRWSFKFTETAPHQLDCANAEAWNASIADFVNSKRIEFHDINQVTDVDTGLDGEFTLIYNQGFEINLQYQKWFAFFENNCKQVDNRFRCDKTAVGWVHDTLSRQWACFYAEKDQALDEITQLSENKLSPSEFDFPMPEKLPFKIRSEPFSHQSLQYQKRPRSNQHPVITPNQILAKLKSLDISNDGLPQSFSWNGDNSENENFVSPVKDQQSCGSCYAFASVAMFESRARVQTNNKWRPIFSEQDIVSCSDYSQGCQGGFPFLISKYGQDYGLVDESCFPYTAQ